MNKQIFSIIVPIYNAEKTIERTLASFISNKDYIKEVILVNDETTDDTFKKVDKFNVFFNIRILNNKYGKGAGTARKTGIKYAKSEWITFVDSDDCLTPSSLAYVYKEIKKEKDIILLHTKSIYYESGNFDKDAIEYSDSSCGGNFYKRKYLLKNNLYPHDTLYMVEDEYFNEKVIKYISFCDKKKNNIKRFDYPVYEVHHDIDQNLSFALRNWSDYCCRYSLLYKQYLTDDFINIKGLKNNLLYEYMDNFIFCYFLTQGLMLDDNEDFELEENKKYFKSSLGYFKDTFNKNENFLINYFYQNLDDMKSILKSAVISIGFEFDNFLNFDDFIKTL